MTDIISLYDDRGQARKDVFPNAPGLNFSSLHALDLARVREFLNALGVPINPNMSFFDMKSAVEQHGAVLLTHTQKMQIVTGLRWETFVISQLSLFSYKDTPAVRWLAEDVSKAHSLSLGVARLVSLDDSEFCGALSCFGNLRSLLELTGMVSRWSADPDNLSLRKIDKSNWSHLVSKGLEHLKNTSTGNLGQMIGNLNRMVHNQDGSPVLLVDTTNSAFMYKDKWAVVELYNVMHTLQACNSVLSEAFHRLLKAFSEEILLEQLDKVEWNLYSEQNPFIIPGDKFPPVAGKTLQAKEARLWMNPQLNLTFFWEEDAMQDAEGLLNEVAKLVETRTGGRFRSNVAGIKRTDDPV